MANPIVDKLVDAEFTTSNPRLKAEVDAGIAQAAGPQYTPDPAALEALGLPGPAPAPKAAAHAFIYSDTFGTSPEYYDTRVSEDRETNEPLGAGNPLNGPVGFVQAYGRAVMGGDNIGINVGKELVRKLTIPSDPAWTNESARTWLETKVNEIPPSQQFRYFGTGSQAEAEQLLADATSDQRAQRINQLRGGFDAFAASALAGLIDVDAPLMLFSGGLSAGAKIGINATKAGRVLVGTSAGAMLGVSMGTLDYAVNPNSDPESILMMAAMGSAFGAFGGSFASAPDRVRMQDMQKGVVEELAEDVGLGRAEPRMPPQAPPDWQGPVNRDPAAGEAPLSPEGTAPRAPRAVRTEAEVEAETVQTNDILARNNTSSVGARATGQQQYDLAGGGIDSVTDPATKQGIIDAIAWERSSPEVRDWEDPTAHLTGVSEVAVRKAIRFRDYLKKAAITSDFDRLFGSSLASARKLATEIFESPSGIANNRGNAAVIKEAYHTRLRRAWEPYDAAFREYHFQEQGFKRFQKLTERPGQGASWKSKDNFDRAVVDELMVMRHGGQSTASPAVQKAAKTIDNYWKTEHEIGLGKQGEIPLEGYDNFPWETGYVPQVWSGRQLARMLEDAARRGGAAGRAAEKQRIVNFIDGSYRRDHPTLDPALSKKMAAAVVERALASRAGFQRDLIALLSGDEADFIEAALARNDLTQVDIDAVLNSITGSRKDKTQLSQTQGRTEVDFRYTDATGLSMKDLLETDMTLLAGRRAHRTAGMAALARVGIPNRVEWEAKKKTILEEQRARGKKIVRTDRNATDKVDDFVDADEEITAEYLDAIYGYFSGIRQGAGSSGDAVVQRIKKVTQLSLMNQLGLTQLAEHGAISSAVGVKRWWAHMSADVKTALGNPDSPLVQELKFHAVFSPEETMFSGRLAAELDRADVGDLGAQFDAVLNKGQEMQGVLSGFYAVRSNQQRVAISSVTAKLYEEGFNPMRLKSMGFDDAFVTRTKQHATFNTKGELEKLNMDRWDEVDVQDFQRNMARVTNQLVQKAMAGESNWAFQANGLAQLFFQLKSFPLLAVNKQFIRNSRMADKENMMGYVWGLAFASSMAAVRETINGRTQNLNPEFITRAGINYANLTGWLAMVTDPVLSALGSDMSVSGYGSRGVGGVISMPASYSVLDRLSSLAGVAVDATDGNLSNANIRVLQTLPLIGNAYGVSGLLNLAKD